MQCYVVGVTLSFLLLIAPQITIAGPIKDCTNTAINLTHLSKTTDAAATNLLQSTYNASNCFGVFNEPKDISKLLVTDKNIGTLGDGLLNGMGGVISPTQFITADQLMDLGSNVGFANATPGTADDPGWISVGKFSRVTDTVFTTDYSAIAGITNLALADIISVNFSCTQTKGQCNEVRWSLTTTHDFVDKMAAALGKPSSFDHLAFFYKSSQNWAVYDFNLTNILNNEINTLKNTGVPASIDSSLSLAGTFKSTDFNKPISEFGLWIRDPISAKVAPAPAQVVPAPASLLLFGLGLIALAGFGRRQ